MAVRVLIVDDSAIMRQLLTEILSGDPDIAVVGTASDPYAAREKIKALDPDVLTLDVEMPRMDGLDFLQKIMTLRPMPVVMVSSLTQKGADVTLSALEIGAVDVVAKPVADQVTGMAAQAEALRTKVKLAARAQVQPRRKPATVPPRTAPFPTTEKIIAIGASTGGVETLMRLVAALPANAPAMVITQHMPAQFTGGFAQRLDRAGRIAVCEAGDGMRALPGHAYLAPGDRHLELTRSGADYVCRLSDGPLVSGHKPSVDVLFQSVARAAGGNAVGVILTGMGRDGADGLLAMRRAGADTFGQDAASCVVYGMPRAAKEAGAVARELPDDRIVPAMLEACRPGALARTGS
ncbi:MAG: chemotaxis response regulator protein-glutamate methylesterase [Alphaproteobacteria bacterium]